MGRQAERTELRRLMAHCTPRVGGEVVLEAEIAGLFRVVVAVRRLAADADAVGQHRHRAVDIGLRPRYAGHREAQALEAPEVARDVGVVELLGEATVQEPVVLSSTRARGSYCDSGTRRLSS